MEKNVAWITSNLGNYCTRDTQLEEGSVSVHDGVRLQVSTRLQLWSKDSNSLIDFG